MSNVLIAAAPLPSLVSTSTLSPSGLDDSFAQIRRTGAFNWNLTGTAGSRNVDTIGSVPLREFKFLGTEYVESTESRADSYQSGFAFVEQVEHYPLIMGAESRKTGKYVHFNANVIRIREAIYLGGGRQADDPPEVTQGSFRITASLSARRRFPGASILLMVKRVARFRPEQTGPAPSIVVSVFDGSTNVRLSATQLELGREGIPAVHSFSCLLEAETDQRYAIPATSPFRVDVDVDCSFQSSILGSWEIAGHEYHFALTSEELSSS